MTGIERLRELGNDYVEHSWSEAGKRRGRQIFDIADQIERERACDADTIENIRLIVGGVIDEMEHHILGHEGMEDSPVARWARELREALGGDGRDPAADVSVSAYDLLPQEDREAVALVRERGGLERVKAQRRESMPRAAYERKKAGFLDHIAECERALGRRREIISELNHRAVDLTRENAELRKRAMPEGYEWPRFEDGEPVRIGDVVSDIEVRSVVFRDGGILLSDCTSVHGWGTWRSYKEPIKRPAVLAADGEPLEVGQTVWHEDGTELRVLGFKHEEDGERIVSVKYMDGPTNWSEVRSLSLTHERPVLAADGRTLREGETVYLTDSTTAFVVDDIITREDGATVVHLAGGAWHRPQDLTHERPDSWERLEEDADKNPFDYCKDVGHRLDTCENSEAYKARDLVRRCKELARKENNNE